MGSFHLVLARKGEDFVEARKGHWDGLAGCWQVGLRFGFESLSPGALSSPGKNRMMPYTDG